MSDVFISYARSTATQAQQVAQALRTLGYGVWRDDELPAHRSYGEVIEERLRAARAVLVIWSAEAVKSQWVQSEADKARAAAKLVQVSIDGEPLPMPFDRIQCADLAGWSGDPEAPGWKKVVASIAALTGGPSAAHPSAPAATAAKPSICVLPFANMSGEAEQEYFSDGISEDIITDLSKVSALSVVARNTAFQFKGKSLDVRGVARQLEVSHVLEGSVRKAGSRVRITAQLIDGRAGDHVWAERYDRDLTDIFALQDEISEAIVKALKLKLLPAERNAIERRGTSSPDAYDLFLMARQTLVSGNRGDIRGVETMIRLCRRAVEIDPAYAHAWALLARAETMLQLSHGRDGVDGLAPAERALALDPNLAEAHAVKARHLSEAGLEAEAWAELELALRLDPESSEAQEAAGLACIRGRRIEDAARHFEEASALLEDDFSNPAMLMTCYRALGDQEGLLRCARTTLERAEKALAQDRSNGTALGFGVGALTVLGEPGRARDWIARALLIDPDNMNMRYNFACALSADLGDVDGAVDLLAPVIATVRSGLLGHLKADPDLDPVRDDPRYRSLVAAADARLAEGDQAMTTSSE